MTHRTNKDPKITDLTVSQLQRLIRRTVHQAVAEVIIEMSAVRQMEEADLVEYEAELNEYLQQSLPAAGLNPAPRKIDD